ncbi:MAG TPA: hypothetical protein VK988_19285 [Acidimicrobiales bacterium]|nr:hypothetical protein [Acidimicrobiales bacterium]
MIAEHRRLVEDLKVRGLADELGAVGRVEEHITWLEKVRSNFAGISWHASALREIKAAIPREVVHSELEHPIVKIAT